jgi:elongation factor Ts
MKQNNQVDFQKLKELREKTDVSFSLCKKALEESKNDMSAAMKLLTKWGAASLTKKAGRKTSQGGIFSYVHHNKKIASLVEILCETDFVSGNAEFQKMGQEFAMQLASMPADTVEDLMKQEYVRDPSKKMSDLFKDTALKFGENMKVSRILRWTLEG